MIGDCIRIRILIIITILLLSAACGAPSILNGGEDSPPIEEPVHSTAADSTTADSIAVSYEYTSEMVTVIYHLYGNVLEDFLVMQVTNEGDEDARVKVVSAIQEYTTEAVDTVLVEAGETVEVRQNPRLNPEAIDQLNAQQPGSYRVQVFFLDEGEERVVTDDTSEIVIYSRRDFPLSISGFDEHEVYELFSVMVTPHDPAVEELLRHAADYHPGGLMTSAYGGVEYDENGSVWRRLEAIWEAEDNVYDLTYISTWVSFAPGDVQRIRLPSEVLEQHSGNCIELTMLYAAAVEALDMEPAIILVPGHAFLAVRMDAVNADYYVVETTMIGQASFTEAVDYGKAELDEAMPHIANGESSYAFITIADNREIGINPIPWR